MNRRLLTQMALVSALLPRRGIAGSEIVLGQSAPLSGPFAGMGLDYRNGALLAFDEANAAGGVQGQALRLVTLDDAYDSTRALANAHALIEQHNALCFLNHMFTLTVLASLPVAVRAGVPYLAPYTGHPDLYRNDQPLLFVTRASFDAEMQKIIGYIGAVGYRRVSLVYYDNKIGPELVRDVRAGLARFQLPLRAAIGIPIGGQTDAAAAAVAASQPDAVILGISGNDAVSFIRHQLKAGQKPVYFARSFVGSKQLHEQLGPQCAGVVISQLVPSPFKAATAVARDYRRLLALRDPLARPSFVELEGFINARVLLAALRKAGPGATRESLARALSSLGRLDLGGYVVEFDARNHVGSRFVELSMLRGDGTFSQ
jgi:ABC-type branched-subunit amino acid transport system substrate-binding protein